MSREFIRGNRDGPNGRNETYTVCRLQVPVARFADEIGRGMHRHLLTCPGPCPAHSDQHLPKKLKTLGPTYFDHAGPEADLGKWDDAKLDVGCREAFEVVHPDRRSRTFTICRLRVPRAWLVEEVEKDLHGRYFNNKAGGRRHVQGKPTHEVDNVNHPHPPCPLRG